MVTMKSTKQEIMDALKEAQAALAARNEVMSEPTKASNKQKEEECIQNAAADVNKGIFSDEMNEKYHNLDKAIKLMEQRLKEQYEVDAALLNLVTVTNATKQLQLDLEATYNRRKAEIEVSLNEMQCGMDAERAALREALANDVARDKLEREREESEYEYERNRNRKIEQDEYNDSYAAAQKKLDAVKAEAAAIAADNEAKKAEIEDMRQKIEAFPDALQERYDIGYEDGEKAAGKEYGYKKAMADKEHEYQIREKDNDIHRLEDTVAAQRNKIESLEDKLDAAYAQIQALASKTVESNGSIKLINNGSENNGKR